VRAEDVLYAVYDATLAFKATLPRPVPAGDIGDTDVYGAQQHARCSMSTFRSDSAAGRENSKKNRMRAASLREKAPRIKRLRVRSVVSGVSSAAE
jgi:hypothetical protein